MQTQEYITQLLERERHRLCASREKVDRRRYPGTIGKMILQRQLPESNQEAVADDVKYNLTGLCMNCTKANSCRLPGRKVGVWHCEEYL